MESPEKVIHSRRKTFQSLRGKHVLKYAESHHCEVNTLVKLACHFSTQLRFLEGKVD